MVFQPDAFQNPGFETQRSGLAAGGLPTLSGSAVGDVEIIPAFQPGAFQTVAFQTVPAVNGGSLSAVSGAGIGLHGQTGVVVGDLPAITGSGDGVHASLGIAEGELPSVTGSGDGAQGVVGAATGEVPSVSGEASGAVVVVVLASGALPNIEGAATGLTQVVGTGIGSLPSVSGEADGSLVVVGLGVSSLPPLSGSSSGQVTIIPAFQPGAFQAVAFQTIHGTIGQATGDLPSISGAAVGDLGAFGQAAGELPSVAGEALGQAPSDLTKIPVVNVAGGTRYKRPEEIEGRAWGLLPSMSGRASGLIYAPAASPDVVPVVAVEVPLAPIPTVLRPIEEVLPSRIVKIEATRLGTMTGSLPAVGGVADGRYDKFSDAQLEELAILLAA